MRWLAWQTERFLKLATHRSGHVVTVRPEQVVEIAFDGVPDDKTADEPDTIEAVQALL